jgi:nucleoside 2-deoxyribosyltransferase
LNIREPTEAGPQGYEMLLREEYAASMDVGALANLLNHPGITDVIIFAAQYELAAVLQQCGTLSAGIHIDLGNCRAEAGVLAALGRAVTTGIVSTSSPIFLETYEGQVTLLRHGLVPRTCSSLLFKENRGGARLYEATAPDSPIGVGAQVRPVVHSVGVGDCFDAAYTALAHKHTKAVALCYASWIAAEYASTTYPKIFRASCSRVMKLSSDEVVSLPGIALPWESRPAVNVYIAAPDFDYLDRSIVEQVAGCLQYHNFAPRMPIRENGQLAPDATHSEKHQAFNADVRLLQECQMVVAVMLFNDPGTICEIGLAAGLGIPVIVYDPKGLVSNPMVAECPKLVSSSLDEVIGEVFVVAAGIGK